MQASYQQNEHNNPKDEHNNPKADKPFVLKPANYKEPHHQKQGDDKKAILGTVVAPKI